MLVATAAKWSLVAKSNALAAAKKGQLLARESHAEALSIAIDDLRAHAQQPQPQSQRVLDRWLPRRLLRQPQEHGGGAPDSQPLACDATLPSADEAAFLGTWQNVEHEGLDGFMRHLGVGWAFRRLAMQSYPTVTFTWGEHSQRLEAAT